MKIERCKDFFFPTYEKKKSRHDRTVYLLTSDRIENFPYIYICLFQKKERKKEMEKFGLFSAITFG